MKSLIEIITFVVRLNIVQMKTFFLKTTLAVVSLATILFFLSKVDHDSINSINEASVEALAQDEDGYETSDYCVCKSSGCKAGNRITFRKWCSGSVPGINANCSEYDDGCSY